MALLRGRTDGHPPHGAGPTRGFMVAVLASLAVLLWGTVTASSTVAYTALAVGIAGVAIGASGILASWARLRRLGDREDNGR